MQQAVAQLPGDYSTATVERDGYLRRIDGLPFGDNPREGFFQGNAFMHPEMRFRFEFPTGWTTSNEKTSVSATAPSEDAVLQVSLAEASTPEAAEEAFFEEDGISQGDSWNKAVHGLQATWSRFEYEDTENKLSGTVAFVKHGGNVFQLLALTTPEQSDGHRKSFETSMASFSRLDDPKALNVQPQRLRLVKLPQEMTLEEFNKKYPSVVKMDVLALINHVQPGEKLPAGTLVKRVVEGGSLKQPQRLRAVDPNDGKTVWLVRPRVASPRRTGAGPRSDRWSSTAEMFFSSGPSLLWISGRGQSRQRTLEGVRLVKLPKEMTMEEFAQKYPSVEKMGLLAHLRPLLRFVPGLLLLLAGPAVATAEGRWTALGPEGGNAVALAASPDGVLWAGTSRGSGLFRSMDGGASWRRAGGALDRLSVLAVAVDPSRPQIVYTGTGGEGIFRSTDGGGTWAPSNQGLPSFGGHYSVVKALVIDPRAPRRVFAATQAGLYLSRDRGASWELSLRYSIDTFAVAPSDSRFVYAIGSGGAVRSTDGGLTWEPMQVFPNQFSVLAVHPTSPETVWAAADIWYSHPTLWRSDDGGRHWEPIWVDRSIRALAVDPGEPDSLWAGVKGGILRVFDRGARRRFFPVSAGDEVISLAFDPAGRVLYAGTGWNDLSSVGYPGRQGGVWRSTDRGRTWRQGVQGMIATEVHAVTAPAPGRVVAAVLGRGPIVGDGSIARWIRGDQGIERTIYDLLADPAAPEILWAATANGVFRSEDDGLTWAGASAGLTGVPGFPTLFAFTSLALDPTVPGGLWVAGWSGLFHSADRGGTWTRVTNLPDGTAFEAVAVDPNDPRKVWAASQGGGGVFPTVFRSEDGGATWQETHFAVYFLDGLAVSQGGTVFVSTLNRLLRSTDGGVTWQEKPPSGVVSVLPDPAQPGSIWAGGFFGLYRSRDDGETWEAVTGGPGTSVILDLAPDSSGGLLVATRGRGLFRLTKED